MKSVDLKHSTMDKVKTWSKTTSDENGSKTLRVEQVENGYIISIDTDDKDKNGDWKYESKKYISRVNPFIKEENIEDESAVIDIAGSFGEFLKSM